MAATLAPMNGAQSRQCVQRWRPHGGALLKKKKKNMARSASCHTQYSIHRRRGGGGRDGAVLFAPPPPYVSCWKIKMISQGRREESVTGEERGDIVGVQRNQSFFPPLSNVS